MTPSRLKRLFGVTWEPRLAFNSDDFVRRVSDALAKAPMSISGVQMKSSVRLNSDTRELEIVSEHGTHILKPTPPIYPGLAVVEELCMTLAERMDFEVPPHGLLSMGDGTVCYVIRRFDRREDGTAAHVEDLQQILGNTDKYTGSLEGIGKVLRQHATYVGLEAVQFFERVVFNFLIGNGDMHLKNWSLLEEDNGTIRLAPCYDFVCTRLYLTDEESALALNGKRNKLRRKDFELLAASLGVDPVAAANSLRRFIEALPPLIDEEIASSGLTAEQKDRFKELVRERASRLGSTTIAS